MLNLALLACINAQQPERAFGLLLKAHSLEKAHDHSFKIADTISYNTVLKGFVASSNIQSCLHCLATMKDHNLHPDDVTLTSLLDISLTDKTGAITSKLVDMLLEAAQIRPLDIGTCNTFIKTLVRVENVA